MFFLMNPKYPLIVLELESVKNRDSQCKPALVSWLCNAFQDPYNSLPIFG